MYEIMFNVSIFNKWYVGGEAIERSCYILEKYYNIRTLGKLSQCLACKSEMQTEMVKRV